MFSSNNRSTQLICGFKVNTNSPEWHKSMTKILKKIKGGEFSLYADEGMAYVSGEGDPNKLLKLMGTIKGKAAEMAFVKTRGHHHYHHDPNLYHNSYFNSYGQSPSYNSYWPSDLGYYPQHPPYYSQSHAMQPMLHGDCSFVPFPVSETSRVRGTHGDFTGTSHADSEKGGTASKKWRRRGTDTGAFRRRFVD